MNIEMPRHAAAEIGEPAPNRMRSFNLTRWFSIASLISIGLLAAVSAMLLSRLLTEQMLLRDAEVGMAFVQTLSSTAGAESYFRGPRSAPAAAAMEEFFERITMMPDVLKANVYSSDGTVIWSSNLATIGKKFDFNPELDAALGGALKIEADILEHRAYIKPEHVFPGSVLKDFVENYIPVWDAQHKSVIGVVELYKEPQALYRTLRRGIVLIWSCALGGAAFLFLVLFWIIRRAHRLIDEQANQLVITESFAAIGEMTATVAHGIRNPLSSIRSSAELMAETEGESARAHCAEIMEEVDRIEQGVRSLVTYTQVPNGPPARVPLNQMAQNAIAEFGREMRRQSINVDWRLDAREPVVVGDPLLLQQVFASLIANALQAMPTGGVLIVSTTVDGRQAELSIADSGIGISPERLERIFVPFRSTKKHGLGVGLPLVRRVLFRFGGQIDMRSELGRGTTATLRFRAG